MVNIKWESASGWSQSVVVQQQKSRIKLMGVVISEWVWLTELLSVVFQERVWPMLQAKKESPYQQSWPIEPSAMKKTHVTLAVSVSHDKIIRACTRESHDSIVGPKEFNYCTSVQIYRPLHYCCIHPLTSQKCLSALQTVQ